MRNIPGVMARVVQALNKKKIRILQTGDSNITISLLIREQDLSEAIRTLHDHFRLAAPPSEMSASWPDRSDTHLHLYISIQ
jgi:aspartate kinase